MWLAGSPGMVGLNPHHSTADQAEQDCKIILENVA